MMTFMGRFNRQLQCFVTAVGTKYAVPGVLIWTESAASSSAWFISVSHCSSSCEPSLCLCWQLWDTVLNKVHFLLKISLEERNILTNVSINFICIIRIHLHPTNHMFLSCKKSGMEPDPLPIRTEINESVMHIFSRTIYQHTLDTIQCRYYGLFWMNDHWRTMAAMFSRSKCVWAFSARKLNRKVSRNSPRTLEALQIKFWIVIPQMTEDKLPST
jgi:hypothetical protein